MSRKKKGAPVVIVRKDKRLKKVPNLIAFGLTGGLSGVYSATKAATNAGYNARTRKLMEAAEEAETDHDFTEAEHAAARERGREAMKQLRAMQAETLAQRQARQTENEQVAEGLSVIARMHEEKLNRERER